MFTAMEFRYDIAILSLGESFLNNFFLHWRNFVRIHLLTEDPFSQRNEFNMDWFPPSRKGFRRSFERRLPIELQD